MELRVYLDPLLPGSVSVLTKAARVDKEPLGCGDENEMQSF